MGHRFADIAFTESVREVQTRLGSRGGYAALDGDQDYNHLLSARETDFISARDSFYMASVSETGWPYVQHRGGPVGFVRVIDAQTIGFADFSGNRQYVSVGNLRRDDRVSLFFMDYPNRTRLKLLGRVRLLGDDEPELLAQLTSDQYSARVERGFVIHLEAFDWNCPQHITPRYTDAEMEPILRELDQLKAGRGPEPGSEPGPTELGDGELALVISAVRQLTPRIRAYELRAPDGGDLPAVQAGAHLQIPVVLADGSEVIRNYSICSNPVRRDVYEIAVLRDDDGDGGSQALHRQFNLGLRLNCALPLNNFTLHSDCASAVLIAGGIGITPIKPMAQALQARGITPQIHYAARSSAETAFRDRLQREFGDHIRFYSSVDDERLDLGKILSASPADAMFYICGPERLIDAVSATADRLGIAPGRVRYEHFTAATITDAKPIQLELRRSGLQLEVAADQSVLDAMLDAGVDALYSCRTGNCRTCAIKRLDGEADHRDSALTNIEHEQDQLFCPCVSRVHGDDLVLDI